MDITFSGYRIIHEGLSVTLFKQGVNNKTGVTIWRFVGHYPRMSTCLERLVEEKLSDSDAKDLPALRDDFREAVKEIRNMFSGLGADVVTNYTCRACSKSLRTEKPNATMD